MTDPRRSCCHVRLLLTQPEEVSEGELTDISEERAVKKRTAMPEEATLETLHVKELS